MTTPEGRLDDSLETPLAWAGSDEPMDELDRLLARVRVPVAPDFSRQVMARLPEPSWQRSRRRQWLWVAAALAALAVGAGLLLGASTWGGLTAAGAIADLLVATLAAGAGLLAASWSGIGATVDSALGGSIPALLGLGAAALCAYAVLFRLLRRKRIASRK